MKHQLPILGVEKLGADRLFAEVGNVIPFHTHCHTYFEMLIYDPFEGHITVNGQAIEIDRPTAILLTPSDFHSTHPQASGATYRKLCFTEETLSPDAIPDCPLAASDPRIMAFLAPLVEQACHHREDTPYLAALIRAAVMTVAREGTRLAVLKPLPSLRLVRDALHIISFEFASPLTLSVLSARLAISPQHLSAVFSEAVGMTFRDYLCDKRLRFAASLLASDEANVSEACLLCGYRNLSHFVRAFRKKFGCSPGQYRERFVKKM